MEIDKNILIILLLQASHFFWKNLFSLNQPQTRKASNRTTQPQTKHPEKLRYIRNQGKTKPQAKNEWI